MSRDVITVGSTMRIPLLYRGGYSQWCERFRNYLEEQTDGETMINSIQNDPKFWTAKEKKTRKIDRLARSLLIQGLPNDIYSLVDSNEAAKDLWDALERQMHGSEYGEQDRKAVILYEYETFKANEGRHLLDTYLHYVQVINDLKKYGYKKDNCELNYKFLNNLQPEWKHYGTLMRQTKNLMDINIDSLYNILKQNQGDVNDALGYKKKAVVVTSDPLALSANKKQEFVKSDYKKVEKKDDKKNKDKSKVKCYNCKKEGHFAKDCKKEKVKDYNYYKTKMLLAKKDSDEQVLSYLDESSLSAEETIAEKRIEKANQQSKYLENQNKDFQEKILEKETKISELEGCVSNRDVEIEKCLERLNECENKLHKIRQTNQTIHMIMPFKDTLYNVRKGIDTFSSVRRPKHSGVIWKKKGSYNTSNVDLSSVSLSKLNKTVKRYSRKDLLSCNNSHLGERSSAYVCHDAMNVSCNSKMCDLFDENNLFIFDDESVRISPVSKMPFKKKPYDSMNVNLQLQVQCVRIDNGTEFKNKTLAKFFDEDEKVGVPSSNTQWISNNMIPNVDEASASHNVFKERLEDAYFDASTSFHDPSNVHTFYQPYPPEKKWTKDHPLHKIIGDPKSNVRTRGQLWKFLIHIILQSMSAKRTSWNEFSSVMASAEALDACASLAGRVEHLEHNKVAQDLEIIKLKTRVKKLKRTNKVKTLKLRRLRKVETSQRVDTSDDTLIEDETEEVRDNTGNVQVEGRQADICQIDMDHAAKVLVEVVTTAKLITEVVAAVSETVSAAVIIPAAVSEIVSVAAVVPTVTAAPVKVVVPSTRRRRGVIIRDPEEESSAKTPTKTKSKDTGKVKMVEEPKPIKKKQHVELDEAYARKLQEELNQDISRKLQ
nr:hypothetical protein [Tanacetum cinerariifolium]